MCGILGSFSTQTPADKRFLETFFKALDLVNYRGPDGFGLWRNGSEPLLFERDTDKIEALDKSQALLSSDFKNPDVFFGHRRLNIIDLSRDAAQPMQADGLCIIFNGEIYNYLELRTELQKSGQKFQTSSDTEVLLKAYEIWRTDCFARFNGMWAVAIWDERRKELILSRDRMGVKPLYYTIIDNRLLFGSEIKQLNFLRNESGLSTQPNPYRLYEFLAKGHQHHSEDTLVEGVFMLRAAHCLVLSAADKNLSAGQIRSRVKPYWNFPDESEIARNSNADFKESAGQLRHILESAVALRLRSDVPVGSALSGGLDSSAIVSILSRLAAGSQKTFSAAFEGKALDERKYAEMAVAGKNIEGVFISPGPDGLIEELDKITYHQDGPFASTSIYAQWEVFKAARAHRVPVMLDGQGADEIFAGYEGFLKAHLKSLAQTSGYLRAALDGVLFIKNHHRYYTLTRAKNKFISPVNWLECFSPSCHDEILVRQKEVSQKGDLLLFGSLHRKYIDPLREALYRATACTSLPSLLTFEDRSSMAFSIESRTPFLDYRMIEFAFKCPTHFHVRSGMRKALMREALKGLIPEAIRVRKDKIGFATPEQAWQKTHFPLLRKRALSRLDEKVFDRTQVSAALEKTSNWRLLSLLLSG